MNMRPVIGVLMVFLLLQYSFGGLYASEASLNNSGVVNNNITIPGNTTIKIGNNASLNLVNATNTTSSIMNPIP